MCWTPFKNRPVRCPSSQSCSDTWRPPVWLLCSLWEPARAFVTADTFISSQSIWKWRKNVMMHEKIASLWILSETNYSCSLWGTPDTTGVLFPGPATKNLGPAQKVSYTSGHWKCFLMLALFLMHSIVSSKGCTQRRCKLKYSKELILGWQMDSLTHTWYHQTVPHSHRLQSCTWRHTVSYTSVLQECSQLHGSHVVLTQGSWRLRESGWNLWKASRWSERLQLALRTASLYCLQTSKCSSLALTGQTTECQMNLMPRCLKRERLLWVPIILRRVIIRREGETWSRSGVFVFVPFVALWAGRCTVAGISWATLKTVMCGPGCSPPAPHPSPLRITSLRLNPNLLFATMKSKRAGKHWGSGRCCGVRNWAGEKLDMKRFEVKVVGINGEFKVWRRRRNSADVGLSEVKGGWLRHYVASF